MAQQTTNPRKAARKKTADRLVETVEGLSGVESALIDDAMPDSWECVALGIHVTGSPTTYWPDAVVEKSGAVIDVNLRRFAPQLYTLLRNDEEVASIEVLRKPTPVDDHRENLYDSTLYLIDVWLY